MGWNDPNHHSPTGSPSTRKAFSAEKNRSPQPSGVSIAKPTRGVSGFREQGSGSPKQQRTMPSFRCSVAPRVAPRMTVTFAGTSTGISMTCSTGPSVVADHDS